MVQGLHASKQEAFSQTQPNLAPAWSRQVQKTNKKTGAGSEFERTLNLEARVERQRGWAPAIRRAHLGASTPSLEGWGEV